MRINFGLPPVAQWGSLGGGLATGALMGQSLADQQQLNEYRRRMLEQQRSAEALQLLMSAAKVAEASPDMARVLYEQARMLNPSLSGVQPPMLDPSTAVSRDMKKLETETQARLEMGKRMGLSGPTLQRWAFGVKTDPESVQVPITMPDGTTQIVPMSVEKLAEMRVRHEDRLAEIESSKTIRGGRSGGDKVSNYVNWHMPDGSIKQGLFNQPPPGATHFTKVGSTDPQSTDAPQPRPLGDVLKIATAQKNAKAALDAGAAPDPADMAVLHAAGMGLTPEGLMPPSVMKPPKKRTTPQRKIVREVDVPD